MCVSPVSCALSILDYHRHTIRRPLGGHAEKTGMGIMSRLTLSLALLAALAFSQAQAQTVLKASHQFPGGKGDVRDEMVQMVARDAKAANVGLDIQVYPGASLFKPNEQWNAMVNG